MSADFGNRKVRRMLCGRPRNMAKGFIYVQSAISEAAKSPDNKSCVRYDRIYILDAP